MNKNQAEESGRTEMEAYQDYVEQLDDHANRTIERLEREKEHLLVKMEDVTKALAWWHTVVERKQPAFMVNPETIAIDRSGRTRLPEMGQ